MSKCYASTVIKVAENEIGYKEKKSNSQLDDKTANAGSGNYTKYARDFDTKYPNWYNGKKNGFAWCDMFVDWCFLTAFGYTDALRLLCQPEKSAGAGCTYSLRYFKNKGRSGKTPKVGAQIFFGTSESNVTHTGIVYSFDKSKVYTIEGNASDQVAKRSYALTNAKIVGYGYPDYDGETGESTTPATPAATKTVDELAKEVLEGKWGNGSDRKTALTNAGYDYAKVQAKVNELLAGKTTSGSKATTPTTPIVTPTTQTSNGKIEGAASFKSGYESGKTFKTTANLRIRTGAGTNKTIIKVLSKGTKVTWYGYYTKVSGVEWYLVKVGSLTGFVSSQYLK